MENSAARSWVWHSTPASRAAGHASLLALLETLLFVGLYWAVWKWWNITWYHWMIVLATPLVLLRSEKSVALGVKWFDQGYWARKNSSDRARLVLVLGAACGYWIVWQHYAVDRVCAGTLVQFGSSVLEWWLRLTASMALVACLLSPSEDEPAQRAVAATLFAAVLTFLAAFLLVPAQFCGLSMTGFCVAALPFAVFAASGHFTNASEVRVALVPFVFVGVALGIGLRALLVRMLATLCHPIAGIKALPANWAHALTVADSALPPELVPGSQSVVYGRDLSLSRRDEVGRPRSREEIWFSLFGVPLIFFPAIVWRWAIKSTAWFYLPLLVIGRFGLGIDDDERSKLATVHSGKVLNIVSFLISLIAVGAAAWAMFRPDFLSEMLATTQAQGAPIPPLAYILVLDWSIIRNQPWQWFYLPSAMISLVLFVAYNAIGRNIAAGIPSVRFHSKLRFMRRLGNLSLMLTLTGLAIALWHFARAMWSWQELRDGLLWWL